MDTATRHAKQRQISNLLLQVILILSCSIAFADAPKQIVATYSPAGFTAFLQYDPDRIVVAIPLMYINDGMKRPLIGGGEIKEAPAGTREFYLEVFLSAFGVVTVKITDIFSIPAVSLKISLSKDSQWPISVLHQDRQAESGGLFDRFGAADQVRDMAANVFPRNESLTKAILSPKTLESIKQDKELMRLLESAYIEGKHCQDFMNRASLCLVIEWKNGRAVRDYIDQLIKSAPESNGPTGFQLSMRSQRAFLRKASPRRQVSDEYFFPAGINASGYDTGDMALFGGLLCLSGEQEGCMLLKCSQTESGQFFRSPANVKDKFTEDQSPFSGDQFNGIVALLLGNKGSEPCPVNDTRALTNEERLHAFIEFVKTQKKFYPIYTPQKSSADFGYKSCEEHYKNETCLLQGSEWFWINYLARTLRLPEDLIPADSRNVKDRYGFDWDLLEWRAAFAPIGEEAFHAHLVGVQIFLARKAGIDHPAFQRAAAILAARQPHNPFFLYLHLGKDWRVAQEVNKKCVDQYPMGERFEWAWQSSESQKNWQKSMGWDCVFMINNLLN